MSVILHINYSILPEKLHINIFYSSVSLHNDERENSLPGCQIIRHFSILFPLRGAKRRVSKEFRSAGDQFTSLNIEKPLKKNSNIQKYLLSEKKKIKLSLSHPSRSQESYRIVGGSGSHGPPSSLIMIADFSETKAKPVHGGSLPFFFFTTFFTTKNLKTFPFLPVLFPLSSLFLSPSASSISLLS